MIIDFEVNIFLSFLLSEIMKLDAEFLMYKCL